MAGTTATTNPTATAGDHQPPPTPPPRPRKVIYSLPLVTASSTDSDSSAPAAAAIPTGHRLGVNSLAVAPWTWSPGDDQILPSLAPATGAASGGMLLSAGRDGAVVGWDLGQSGVSSNSTSSPLMVLRGHLDWVNDVLVPNVPLSSFSGSDAVSGSGWAPSFVSASNDRSVRLWRVHPNPNTASSHPLSATGAILGHHNDYVKCLGFASGPQFIVSGGLDRRIGLWDLGSEMRGNIGWLTVPDSSPKQSIYTVSTHPAGSLIVSGSPDKLIRLWDPRSLRKFGQLVGHTDHVRSVVLSPDAHSVLSASSDGTVKLWSLHTNRCIATYTHHSDSVWTLSPTFSSTGGSFSGFYSAGRDGSVFRTEFVQPESGVTPSSAATMSMLTSASTPRGVAAAAAATSFATSSVSISVEEEPASRTLLLFRDTAPKSESASQKSSSTNGVSTNGQQQQQQQPRGIHHLVGHNGVVYTATANSTILGWMDARPEDWEQVNGLFVPGGDGDDDDDEDAGGADLDLLHPGTANGVLSPASEASTSFINGHTVPTSAEPFPMLDQDAAESDLSLGGPQGPMLPLHTSPIVELQGHHGLIKHSLLSNKRHVLTQDTAGNVELWDIVRCQRIRSFGKDVDFDGIRSEINVPEYNVNWCSVDTRIGTLSVQLTEQRCFDAEMYLDESGVDGIEYLADQRTNIGRWVLVSLFRHFVAHKRAPPSPPPIHSSMSISNGATNGNHDANDDESDTRSDDSLPLVPPVPPMPAKAPPTPRVSERTLKQDYNQPPAATAADDDDAHPPSHDRTTSTATVSTTATDDTDDRGRSSSRSTTPASTSSSTAPGGDAADASPRPRSRSRSIVSRLRRISLRKLGVGDDSDASDSKKEKEKEKEKDKKSKSAPTSPVVSRGVMRAPSMPLVQGKLPSFAAAAAAAKSAMSSKPATTTTATTAGAAASTQQTPSAAAAATAVAIPGMPAPVPIPNDTVVAIMEEEPDACSPVARWIGTVGTAALHPSGLQSSLPAWLEDLLLRDNAPTKDPVKIGFQLTAQPGSGLPELRSGNQRLLANRLVRVRRILAYIAENAGIAVPEGKAVEEQIELVIAGQPVNPMLTLATVKTYVWRAGGEGDLSATYRLRTTLMGPAASAVAGGDAPPPVVR